MIVKREKKPRLPFIESRFVVVKPEVATCPRCMRKHTVEYGKTGGVISKTIRFVTCRKGRTYLVGLGDLIL